MKCCKCCVPKTQGEMALLSRQEAQMFLRRLGLTEAEANSRSVHTLTRIVQAMQMNVPFQSISMMAVPQGHRHVPTLEEVVAAGVSMEGGVCYTLNTFCCILLKALGYRAFVLDGETVAGSYNSSGVRRSDHVVVLVRNVRYEGDAHIVDVGTGYPFFQPIALDELPVTFRQAGLEYMYKREGRIVYRMHKLGENPSFGEKNGIHGEWRQVFHFRLDPVDYDFFRKHMEQIYVNPQSLFLNSIRAVRFPNAPVEDGTGEYPSATWGFGNTTKFQYLLAVKDQTLMVGPMDNLRQVHLEKHDWARHIKENFPTIPPGKVDAALRLMYNKI